MKKVNRDRGIGYKLKLLRLKTGKTQTEFCKEIGIARSCVSNYEAGSRFPEVEKLKMYADYFHIPMDYFYDIEEMRERDLAERPTPEHQHFIDILCKDDNIIKRFVETCDAEGNYRYKGGDYKMTNADVECIRMAIRMFMTAKAGK